MGTWHSCPDCPRANSLLHRAQQSTCQANTPRHVRGKVKGMLPPGPGSSTPGTRDHLRHPKLNRGAVHAAGMLKKHPLTLHCLHPPQFSSRKWELVPKTDLCLRQKGGGVLPEGSQLLPQILRQLPQFQMQGQNTLLLNTAASLGLQTWQKPSELGGSAFPVARQDMAQPCGTEKVSSTFPQSLSSSFP